MDTKKTRALLTALEKGSLTAAAEELGYTQSGLTHMMNSLEDELGLKLLVRSKGGVRLSPAGQELLPKLRALDESAHELERAVEKLCKMSHYSLNLGTYSSIARQWMPAILSDMRHLLPQLDVSISVTDASEIYSSVRAGKLDCAIVSHQPALCQGLSFVPLRYDRMVAVLPNDYVAAEGSFPVEKFEGERFLVPADGFELDIMPSLSVKGRRVSPIVRYTNLDDAATASMVAHGLGLSIMSELVMEGINESVQIRQLEPPVSRSLGIIVSENRLSDRNIKLLIKCAQRAIEQKYAQR